MNPRIADQACFTWSAHCVASGALSDAQAWTKGSKLLEQYASKAVTCGESLLPVVAGGGGGFMTVWLQHKHKAFVIDYRETAPVKIKSKYFLNESGKLDKTIARHTGLSVAVPGNVAGLCYGEFIFSPLPTLTISLFKGRCFIYRYNHRSDRYHHS